MTGHAPSEPEDQASSQALSHTSSRALSARLEAAALIVRAALQAVAAQEPIGEPAPMNPPPLAAVAPPRAEVLSLQRTEPVPAPAASPFTTFAGARGLALDDGLGGKTTFGVGIEAGVGWQRLGLGLAAEQWLAQDLTNAARPSASELSRQALGLLARFSLMRFERGRIDLEASTGLTVLRLSQRDLALPASDQEVTRAHAGAGLAAAIGLWRGPLRVSLVAGAGLRGVFDPPSLYSGPAAVWTMTVLSPRATLGLEVNTDLGR